LVNAAVGYYAPQMFEAGVPMHRIYLVVHPPARKPRRIRQEQAIFEVNAGSDFSKGGFIKNRFQLVPLQFFQQLGAQRQCTGWFTSQVNSTLVMVRIFRIL
jgi:hypothetical protein